jgi:hypothetical protein
VSGEDGTVLGVVAQMSHKAGGPGGELLPELLLRPDPGPRTEGGEGPPRGIGEDGGEEIVLAVRAAWRLLSAAMKASSLSRSASACCE